jgi:ABC-type polysaccharide/polyol phosphate transport system ATPase subunit
MYWIATFIWDMCLYTILTGTVILSFFCYGKESAKIFVDNGEATFAVFLLVWLYGASSIPLCYIYSLAFENHSTAQISIMTINFMTGFVAVFAYFIMISIPSTQHLGQQLVHLFRMFPPYNIGEGLIAISSAYFENNILGNNLSYLGFYVTGRNILYMTCEAIGYFCFVLLTESTYVRNVYSRIEKIVTQIVIRLSRADPSTSKEEDSDVISEGTHAETIVQDTKLLKQYPLVVKNLVKTYPPSFGDTLKNKIQPKRAVRSVSLACSMGERFGLLGINGAGKTTTLGILTGDIQCTSGEAYINGIDLSDRETSQLIGYCPQIDPLLDLMTGYETLWFFGRVRGIEKSLLISRCNQLIKDVGLSNYANKPCGQYSGGNKRKLSLAIALIGNPMVLFLDEVS